MKLSVTTGQKSHFFDFGQHKIFAWNENMYEVMRLFYNIPIQKEHYLSWLPTIALEHDHSPKHVRVENTVWIVAGTRQPTA